MTKKSVVLLLCVIVGIVGIYSLASQKVTPPHPDEFVGAWFGYDQDNLKFCRLELNSEGKGFCTTTFVDHSPELYLITQWSLKDTNMTINVEPIDGKAERIYLSGLPGYTELDLEIGGVDMKWKRKIRLINESLFLSKNSQAKERIEQYKKSTRN